MLISQGFFKTVKLIKCSVKQQTKSMQHSWHIGRNRSQAHVNLVSKLMILSTPMLSGNPEDYEFITEEKLLIEE